MSILIGIKNLCKNYDKEKVVENFNYCFDDKGFYVLIGASGCGKTTLINSIMGLTDFKGEISINGTTYENQVQHDSIKNFTGYITQDVQLIEYLTIEDNIKLCCADDKKIQKIVEYLHIEKILKNFPGEISGGEKQRVAIAQCLVQNKKIIILDEPTSSLDKKNKKEIFKLLKQISKEKLIICATHDKEIMEYASHIINISEKSFGSVKDFKPIEIIKNNSTSSKRKIASYIFKHRRYKNREKKSDIIIIIVFILCILTTFLCTKNPDKILNSMIKLYNVNYLRVECSNEEKCLEDFKKNKVIHHSFIYNLNTPQDFDDVPDGGTIKLDYDPTVLTLPYNKEFFPYHNEILYGNYFTDEFSVILSYDAAYSYSLNYHVDMKNIIGEMIHIDLYGKSADFKVAGILNKLSSEAKMYLNSNMYFESQAEQTFISDKFTNNFGKQGQQKITYFIYFENSSNLIKYYKNGNKEFIRIQDMNEFFVEHKIMLESIAIYLYPAILISIIISIIFYFQTKLIEIKYKDYIFGVYEHYGYELKEVKKAYFSYLVSDIIRKYLISCILAIILSKIIDEVNNKLVFFKYQMFSTNIYYIIGVLFLLILVATIINIFFFKKMKTVGWYENIKKERDLI